jgi:hypothetical protein
MRRAAGCGPDLPALESFFQPNFTSKGELKTQQCSKWLAFQHPEAKRGNPFAIKMWMRAKTNCFSSNKREN